MKALRVFFVPLLLASLSHSAGLAPEATRTEADRALLARVMTEESVVQSLPSPSPTTYLFDLVAALGRRLQGVFGTVAVAPYLRILAWALLGAMALVVLWIGFSFLRRPRKGPRGNASTVQDLVCPALVLTDAPHWRARVASLLEHGDIDEAVLALWLYLAHSIGGGTPDSSWTVRELLEQRGRLDLMAFGLRLERFLYGPPPTPRAADVGALLGDLERAVQ